MLKPGDRFGDYTVVRLLGKGGMGAVYLLENANGAQVAAKILDPASSGDHESRKRFLREAELALGVKHLNLVETYDVGEDPDTGLCYILMEYVPGGSLADYLKENGALPVEDAVAVVEAMAGVLELARQKGIVHRDIKPANIMFDAEGTPKLADLGIARGGSLGTDTTTVTQTGMMIGTPAYMAPEQMLDAHNVDTRADIYSLGVVFYEMLTGERPNKDDTVVQLMAKAVKGEPLPDVRTLRPEVSASLAQLLAMMVVPDKDGRIATPGQITNALAIIERGGTFVSDDAKARRKEKQQVLRLQRKRRRRIVLVSALSLVMLVALAGIGLGVAWLMRGEGPIAQTVVETPSRPAGADLLPVRGAVVTNVVEKRSTPAAGPTGTRESERMSEPKVAERLVVVTNVVGEQERKTEKPVVQAQPPTAKKKPGGETDRRVRFAEIDGCSWFYTLEDGEAVIWRGEHGYNNETRPAVRPEPMGAVAVPASLGGHRVKAIGCLAFFRCRKMTSVKIPEGVRELRGWAFLDCDALKDVDVPDSLETMKAGAFCSCRSLRSVDIRKCRSIVGTSFRMCSSLGEIRVSNDNPSYVAGGGALLARDAAKLIFYSRTRDAVDWPKGLREIGEGAFCGCMMKEICIPDSVEKIGPDAFANCSLLERIVLGQGVRELGGNAFWHCGRLRAVDFPKSLTCVGSSVAGGCRSLERIVFRGDAPRLVGADRELTLGKIPESVEILVAPGTKGWNGPGTSDLPKLWPLGNFEDSRPIRRLTSADDRELERMLEASRSSFGDVLATSEEVRDFMRNLRLPLVRFRPPATISSAVDFFREAAGGRLNISLRISADGGTDVLPELTASDLRFDDALKLVCDCVDYRYDIHDNIVCIHHKQTLWPWTPRPGKKSGNAADRALLATRLPEFKIKPPSTVVDLIDMIRKSAAESPASPLASVRWSAKDHQGRASCPQVPTVVVRNVSAWNVLDMVCSSVNWCFETKGDVVMLMPRDMSEKRSRSADDFDWNRYFSSDIPLGEALNKVRMRADVRNAIDKKADKLLENVTKMQTCVREVLEADAAFKAGIALTRLESEIARFVRLKTSPTAKCSLAPWEEQAEVLGVAEGKCLLFVWLSNKVEDGPANERLKKMTAAAAKDLESQAKRLQQLKKKAGVEF